MGKAYGVNIIPEIDIPAHSLAFAHYKPEIASEEYGMDHLDLYKEETYRFVDTLLDEYLSWRLTGIYRSGRTYRNRRV